MGNRPHAMDKAAKAAHPFDLIAQLRKLLAAGGPSDVVIIPAVDRLSRDTTDLLVIVRDLQKAGAGLRSIAEPVVDTTSDFAELVLAMLGVAAKLERRRIKERTARGRADATAKGVKFGRKPKLTEHQKREAIKRRDIDAILTKKRTARLAAATMSVPPRFRGWPHDRASSRATCTAFIGSTRSPIYSVVISGISGLGPSPHQPVLLNSCQRHTEQPEPRHFPCLPIVHQK